MINWRSKDIRHCCRMVGKRWFQSMLWVDTNKDRQSKRRKGLAKRFVRWTCSDQWTHRWSCRCMLTFHLHRGLDLQVMSQFRIKNDRTKKKLVSKRKSSKDWSIKIHISITIYRFNLRWNLIYFLIRLLRTVSRQKDDRSLVLIATAKTRQTKTWRLWRNI